jgi:hypothetical protein
MHPLHFMKTYPERGYESTPPGICTSNTARRAWVRALACLLAILLIPCHFTKGQVNNLPPAALLTISNVGLGQYQLGGNGAPGLSYVIQANCFLSYSNWQALGMVTGDLSGIFTFTDSNQMSQRFYRSVSVNTSNPAPAFAPASIAGLAYYWNYNDVPLMSGASGWSDRMQGVQLLRYGNEAVPTNWGFGVRFDGNPPEYLTNSGITLPGTNFSLWYVLRSTGANSGRATLIGAWTPFEGFYLNNEYLDAYWGSDSSASFQALVNQDLDVVYSNGKIFTNGILAGVNIATPTTAPYFQTVGNCDGLDSFFGYVKYIGIWTNYSLTASDVSNLDIWVNDNGVTNVTGGLIAWWPLDEGFGLSTADMSGEGHNGSLSNSPTWSTGLISNALTFASADSQFVNVTNSGGVADNLPNFTVSCWFKTTTSPPDHAILVGKFGPGGYANGPGWALEVESGGICDGEIQQDGGEQYIESTGVRVTDGAWHQYVMTCDSAQNVNAYFDGAPLAQENVGTGPGSVSTFTTTNNIRIGNDYDFEPFNGTIDDVRIYDRVLTAKEVEILFRWRNQP